MNRFCIPIATVALLSAPLFVISGEPPVPPKKERPIRIDHTGAIGEKDIPNEELCVLDGDLVFLTTWEHGQKPGEPGDPRLPTLSLQFLREYRMLRARIQPIGAGFVPHKLLAKDGWYVTADFSTDPPQVILTEKPTKGSHWASHDADLPGRFLFKNEDAPGKAAWLAMEKEGKTYNGGISRKPILTAEKHRFGISDANSGK